MNHSRIPKKAGWVVAKALPKGPNGFALCRQCGRETSGPRRTFCSPECVHDWKIVTQPSYQAAHVFKRDRGVCRSCGLDTMAAQQHVMTLVRRARETRCTELLFELEMAARKLGLIGKRHRLVTFREVLGNPDWVYRRPWEMDHIVAVVDGGGGCGLENLQTLCIPEHRAKTAELARRRAAARRRGG